VSDRDRTRGTATRDRRPPVGSPEHPALRERRRSVARDLGRRRRNRSLWLLGALAAAALLYWALTGPLLAVHGVNVRGYDRADREQLVAALTDAGESGSVLSPPRAAMEEAVRPFPWVESITVVRNWPRALGVQVTQVRPVAHARGTDGGTVLVGSNGRVLESSEGAAALGWLSLPTETPVPGAQLPDAESAVVTFLGALDPELAARVRDLRMVEGGTALARLDGGPELRLGRPVRLVAKATALGLVLQALASEEAAAATYVDLSVPEHPAVGGLEEAGEEAVDSDGDGIPDDEVSEYVAADDGVIE
jgi:cell division septal protein FtsQ